MPTFEDQIGIFDTVQHTNRPISTDSVDIHQPPPHLQTTEMSWGVFDILTNEVTQFDSDGGHFRSLEGHRYLIFVRAIDHKYGVQKVSLDGSGVFRCATDVDRNGIYHEAVLPLFASVPHQQTVYSVPAPLHSLVVVMAPDIGAFDYFRLSGGFHHLQGTSGSLEYFAFSGLMTFSATATNGKGFVSMASLTTAA